MSQHSIVDPVYGATILLVVSNREVANNIIAGFTKDAVRPLSDRQAAATLLITRPDGFKWFMVWLPEKPRGEAGRLKLLHECDHLRDLVMEAVGVKYDASNPEPRTYYLQFLFATICRELGIRI